MRPTNVDVRIRRRDYASQPADTLLVTSLFPTVQGEGPYSGRRSVFLRLAGCNLGGKGVEAPGCLFCDTDFRFKEGKSMGFGELYLALDELHPGPSDLMSTRDWQEAERMWSPRRLVVITGGEPMMQPNLIPFLSLPNADEFLWQIETNGTFSLAHLPSNVTVVVSPKVPQLLPKRSARVAAAIIPGASVKKRREAYASNLMDNVLGRADALKFIVSADPESPYHVVPEYADRFLNPDKPVYVSPMTVYQRASKRSFWQCAKQGNSDIDFRRAAANHAYAAELAMQRGFVVSLQTHLFMGVE